MSIPTLLPKEGTPEWVQLTKDYLNSTKEWRNQKGKELKFRTRVSFQTAMANRNIFLIEHQKTLDDTPEIISDYKLPPDTPWPEIIRIIKEMDTVVAFHQKLPQEVTITIPSKLPIGIVESADWQLGQFGVDYDAFERDINTIVKEPGVYVNIGGDGIYNIIQASKMGSSHNQVPISVQKGLFVQILRALRKKILTIKTGNHDYWDATLTGEDWLGEKARKLHIIYIKHGGRINYKLGDQVYSEFAIHKGRYQSSFNQTHSNKQYQRLHAPWARIITIEHNHIGAVETYQYDGRECVAVRPGTYAIYDDYALQNGFYGTHVCTPIIILFPDRDCLVAFKDLTEGIRYLRTVRASYLQD
jgi:hypothetical protein